MGWPILDNWCLRPGGDRYTAPEVTPVHACGTVDGREVVTAPVIDAHGRDIHCADGTGYTLGEPDPDYVAHCERIGKPIDPNQPVRFVRATSEEPTHDEACDCNACEGADILADVTGEDGGPASVPVRERTTLPATPWGYDTSEVIYDATGEIAVVTIDPENTCSAEVQFEIAALVAAAPLVRVERDQLAQILKCEQGKWAPEGPLSAGWTWHPEDWEWTGVAGARSEDEEPINLYVRHRAYWSDEDDQDDNAWSWFVVEQIGQGDEGDTLAAGTAPTALEAIELAGAAVIRVRGER